MSETSSNKSTVSDASAKQAERMQKLRQLHSRRVRIIFISDHFF